MRFAAIVVLMILSVGCGGGGGGSSAVGGGGTPVAPPDPVDPPVVPVDAQFSFGPSELRISTWISGKWTEEDEEFFEYDANGRTERYGNISDRTYYQEYDSQDRLIQERRYWTGLLDLKTDYEYGPQGFLVSTRREGTTPGTWEIWLDDVTTYEYNPDGTLRLTETSSNENGVSVVTESKLWEYTAQGLPLSVTSTYSDPTVSDTQIIYEFDANDQLVCYTYFEYSDSGGGQGTWQEIYYTTREYGPSGYMQTKTNFTPDDQPYRRYLYERSVDGVAVRVTIQKMKDSKWENDTLNEYYYADSGSSHYWEQTWDPTPLRWGFFQVFGGDLLR